MDLRVRYAPSPTGLQHVGGIRTALFNYLYARASGGAFILRLEDTDRSRSDQKYVKNLYDTLEWLGIDWDEGPDKGGPYGPYLQSERFELYRKQALELVEKGAAYYCFCDEERLSAMRKEQEAARSGFSGYDRHCRFLDPDEVKRNLEAGKPRVIRLKIPSEGMTFFDDRLLGRIEWRNSELSPDPILLKSDGFPTYHLANVVDDHSMRISHVMRAQEWIPSTPLHVILYRALGWEHPEYCHLPMVLGQDGHKLSKRHGAVSVDEFRNSGYLPEALLNYLGMLGASYEEGRDLYSLADFERLFSLGKLKKASAVFDYKKLEWFNGQYIRRKGDGELARLVEPFAIKASLFGPGTTPPSPEQSRLLEQAIPLVKERISFMKEAPGMMAYLFADPVLPPPEDFIPKNLDAMRAIELLGLAQDLAGRLAELPEGEAEELLRSTAGEAGARTGDLLMPLRVALTGSKVSPPLLESLRVLGAEAARRRISRALGQIAGA